MNTSQSNGMVMIFEFHIAAKLRKKYQLDDTLFATDGQVVFADFASVRQFVHEINQFREPSAHIYPGEVNAAGLIDEIFHLVIREYEMQVNNSVMDKAFQYMSTKLGAKTFAALLEDFIEIFPPADLYKNNLTPAEYLQGHTQGRTHTSITLEEAMMLFLANFNPANKKLIEFFDEEYLSDPKVFRQFADALDEFFRKEPPFGPENQDVLTLLKTPLLKAPADLYAQLEYILENWKTILPEKILIRILKGKDLMKEDFRPGSDFGSAPTIVPVYKEGAGEGAFSIGKSGFMFAKEASKSYEEYERFTADTHWMPRVVLMAKNTYVWLDQLSKQFHREIHRLDQIPDEALDQLAKWNFNGLWLIGIWERSQASKRIKHIMGNTDAVSSAYSLYDYEIASDLGGEPAYQNLNERARIRGIRLASDMVPNHTGLHSKWVIEHPDYFIQTRVSPFPGYRFTGENLSQHPDVEIRIDDGYYSRTDAAVVFQRTDTQNNDVRYIYHGNDGTNMPWNDTAQLDMLKQEVREAVIQKIFDVARRFSIIRFDAAMTLAKKHFSRLWYPRPGTGGDIPSRSDFAMTEEEFDAFFPVEFWREVVDRINNDMPETLLLAEAFWMMEGYFVRTLGMHRVYNSAFMHMLMNEENEKYRDLITNTLEFEPEILKRYVNFMSNPDEETAIRQFGTDDKYFGVCVLMSTLPGLPMFAHGQIEGYTEKYGMEYQRAYYNEQPIQWLVERHEREIFPITQKRHIFSEIDHFNIFDFITDQGFVNENVYAYTNKAGNERALVLFNNKYDSITGRMRVSAPKLTKKGAGKTALTVNIGEALSLNPGEKYFYIFREHISGLEYLRSGNDIYLNGFRWGLNGFEYRIFLDFREVYDENGMYATLCTGLNGYGIKNIDDHLSAIRLQPVHKAFEDLLNPASVEFVLNEFVNPIVLDKTGLSLDGLPFDFEALIQALKPHLAIIQNSDQARSLFSQSLIACFRGNDFIKQKSGDIAKTLQKYGKADLGEIFITGSNSHYRENISFFITYLTLEIIGLVCDQSEGGQVLIEKLHLRPSLSRIFKRNGRSEQDVTLDIQLIEILLKYRHIHRSSAYHAGDAPLQTAVHPASDILSAMLSDPLVQQFLGVNEYQKILYFSKERFNELVNWFFYRVILDDIKGMWSENDDMQMRGAILEALDTALGIKEASETCSYEFEKLQRYFIQIGKSE